MAPLSATARPLRLLGRALLLLCLGLLQRELDGRLQQSVIVLAFHLTSVFTLDTLAA